MGIAEFWDEVKTIEDVVKWARHYGVTDITNVILTEDDVNRWVEHTLPEVTRLSENWAEVMLWLNMVNDSLKTDRKYFAINNGVPLPLEDGGEAFAMAASLLGAILNRRYRSEKLDP